MDTPRRRTTGDNPSRRGSTAVESETAAGPASEPKADVGSPQEGTETGARHDSDWIYRELGLSAEAYKGDPAGLPRSSDLDLDMEYDGDALHPGDPHGSPFPPGSLGGGLADPPTRRFEGFPPPGSGLPSESSEVDDADDPPADGAGDRSGEGAADDEPNASDAAVGESAAGARPLAKAPVKGAGKGARGAGASAAHRPDPAVEDSPFHGYDSRSWAGEDVEPSPAPRPATSGVPRSPRPEAIIPAESDRLTADSLTAEKVLRQRKTPPTSGWRKGLLSASGGLVNLGPSQKELRTADFVARVRTPIQGCHRLAVISLKGGVGKTTTAAALGSTFASLRGDRVIAIDANPDRGTLGDKIVTGGIPATVRDFVARSPRLDRYSAVRELTGQADSRLEVVASESDPLASMAFSENDYRVISEVLERFYNLILTDCGTGLLHSAMVGVLAKAEQVVIVSSASLDGARSASATLDWLEAHNYGELARESVTVVTSVRPQASTVHLQEIVGHFARRTRAVVAVPYDAHLAEGGTIDLDRMDKATYQAYLELAAEVGDAFGRIPGG